MTATAPPPLGPERPVWPYAIGAVSIAMACLGLLELVGLMLQIAMAFVLGGGGMAGLRGLFGPTSGWQVVMLAHHAFRPMLSAVLLVGGLMLFKHNRSGPLLHWIYAVPSVLLAVAYPIAYILNYPPQLRPQMLFWPIWQATQSAVYPVFVMVWFRRARIREQTSTWA